MNNWFSVPVSFLLFAFAYFIILVFYIICLNSALQRFFTFLLSEQLPSPNEQLPFKIEKMISWHFTMSAALNSFGDPALQEFLRWNEKWR